VAVRGRGSGENPRVSRGWWVSALDGGASADGRLVGHTEGDRVAPPAPDDHGRLTGSLGVIDDALRDT
jgi:hypothetical protein